MANLASAFFGLLSGGSESPASVSARRCFAHAVLDHPLPSPANANYTAEMDAQIRSHFTATGGPTLVLIQGPYRVDFILEDPPTPGTPKSVGTINTMSSTMTAANGGPANLMDAIFVGYTLHNELLRCSREDKEQFARLALFLLITLGASCDIPFAYRDRANDIRAQPTRLRTGYTPECTDTVEMTSGTPRREAPSPPVLASSRPAPLRPSTLAWAAQRAMSTSAKRARRAKIRWSHSGRRGKIAEHERPTCSSAGRR